MIADRKAKTASILKSISEKKKKEKEEAEREAAKTKHDQDMM